MLEEEDIVVQAGSVIERKVHVGIFWYRYSLSVVYKYNTVPWLFADFQMLKALSAV